MSVFTQIIILIVVLSSMVMVLLAIRQLTHFEGFDDAEETRHLKEDLQEKSNILSQNSIFSNLVEADEEKVKETQYSSKSKDPVSRRE